ncbi:immunoglobulin superfamily member 1-like isoform X1 [Alligator sinensis]|uniref:immunoglobulin superfamily member 1-like isoform X1 n=1 Tax=Alligator sinensis TaxID=38654 RepID=UPI000D71F2AD|nr:immunoglobulin superfamily member 1-like isoform X1 [Alligator sinensis]XP_025052935.1 immunoglobulin superfamily member 1-like isoform X1 [Alligator sinensis]XP_025052947.1 immunoglobulin superfamily member 1-like isoform X1 [Alligator sinensis]
MPLTLPLLLLTVSLPKPSIFWNQAPGAEGGYQLHCSAPRDFTGAWFILHRDSTPGPVAEEQAPAEGSEVTFLLPYISPGEQYRCSYRAWDAAGEQMESLPSDPTNITSDRFPKPSIAVRPGTEVLPGQAWTIRCWAPYPGTSFVLYRQREFWREEAPRGEPPTAEFHLSKASAADAGRYTCYYHTMAEPFVWSNASDPVELRVTDVPSAQEKLVDTAGKLRVNCSMPFTDSVGGWFYLYRDGDPLPLAWITAFPGDDAPAGFNLPEEEALSPGGVFICRYGMDEPEARANMTLNDTDTWTQGSRIQDTDYTKANVVRLGLGAVILLLALLFVTHACWEERCPES